MEIDSDYLRSLPLCKLYSIKLFNQNINSNIIRNCMNTLYKNIAFSLFPYKIYKIKNSLRALEKYNSGNCIAFNIFLKTLLQKNYGIFSYIIPASVPKMFKVKGTRHLTHVALLIPITSRSFMILEPALYFVEPMFCDININNTRRANSANIYNYSNDPVYYTYENVENLDIGDGQKLLDNCKNVICYYEKFPHDKWMYYLVEVTNPDESIGMPYVYLKSRPFLTITTVNPTTGYPELLYHVKIDENGKLIIKHKKNEIFNDDISVLQNETLKTNNVDSLDKLKNVDSIIFGKLKKYFSNYIF